jgi:hypothetical protein
VEAGDRLFFTILSELDKAGILKSLILIGGWCQKLYRIYFNNPVELSPLRTADIDFLIPLPIQIEKKIDLSSVLAKLGFDETFSTSAGYRKYVHPDLEIEFLVTEVGRATDKPFHVKILNINAQRLRYLNILQKDPIIIDVNDIKVTVANPSAFVINKLITSTRRKNKQKREKDLTTAIELREYLLYNKYQNRIRLIFNGLHPRIKKKIMQIIKIKSEILYTYLP